MVAVRCYGAGPSEARARRADRRAPHAARACSYVLVLAVPSRMSGTFGQSQAVLVPLVVVATPSIRGEAPSYTGFFMSELLLICSDSPREPRLHLVLG